MPTQLLSLGPIQALVQNLVYALPAVQCELYTDAATPTIQTSNVSTFATFIAPTLVNGAVKVNGGFIRATTTPTNITLKRA